MPARGGLNVHTDGMGTKGLGVPIMLVVLVVMVMSSMEKRTVLVF